MNYCPNCGNSLISSDKFCPSCGSKIGSYPTMVPKSKFSYEFKSNILLGGDILTPDKIVVDHTGVTYLKRNKYLIGKDRVHLSYSNISLEQQMENRAEMGWRIFGKLFHKN